jgi:hypothetical protein
MRRSGGRPELRSISYFDASRKVAVLACLVAQTGGTPFNPRHAVKKFAGVLGEFGVSRVGLHSVVTASTAHIDETQVADVRSRGRFFRPVTMAAITLFLRARPLRI